MIPDNIKFLILGAAKSGTTTLCNLVAQHPDICFSTVKEPVFFEAEFEKGIEHYWTTYFSNYGGERASGEGRAFNLYLPYVPERIASTLPDARLIALLRDPVERAYSHWWHRYTRRHDNRPFADAIEADLRRIEAGDLFVGEAGAARWREGLFGGTRSTRQSKAYHGFSRLSPYVEMGYYAEQVARYHSHFPPGQLLILFADHLAADPQGTVQSVWRHIGIDDTVQLADASSRNQARAVQRGVVEYLAARMLWKLGVHRLVPVSLKQKVKDVFRPQQVKRPPLDPAVRAELAAHYEPHDAALVRLLGVPLPYRRQPVPQLAPE